MTQPPLVWPLFEAWLDDLHACAPAAERAVLGPLNALCYGSVCMLRRG